MSGSCQSPGGEGGGQQCIRVKKVVQRALKSWGPSMEWTAAAGPQLRRKSHTAGLSKSPYSGLEIQQQGARDVVVVVGLVEKDILAVGAFCREILQDTIYTMVRG